MFGLLILIVSAVGWLVLRGICRVPRKEGDAKTALRRAPFEPAADWLSEYPHALAFRQARVRAR